MEAEWIPHSGRTLCLKHWKLSRSLQTNGGGGAKQEFLLWSFQMWSCEIGFQLFLVFCLNKCFLQEYNICLTQSRDHASLQLLNRLLSVIVYKAYVGGLTSSSWYYCSSECLLVETFTSKVVLITMVHVHVCVAQTFWVTLKWRDSWNHVSLNSSSVGS